MRDAFVIVTVAIIIDTILGVIRALISSDGPFDFRKLPQFLASGILPYVGGLGVVAIAAQYIGEPFLALFYAAAAATTAKYIAEIKDKLQAILGVEIKEGEANADQ